MSRVRLLYGAAFAGGASILGFELSAARLLSPFYGQSYIVWSSIFAMTLAGLSAGYFAGGRIIDRYPRRGTVLILYAAAAAGVMIVPVLAPAVLRITYGAGLRTGVLLATLVLVALPMALMGTLAPSLVRIGSDRLESLGRHAGRLYSVSTLGSIFGTFLFGFFILPAVQASGAVVAASWLLALALLLLLNAWERIAWMLPVAGGAACGLFVLLQPGQTRVGDWWIVAREDGLHGRLVVADLGEERWLFVDGIPQSRQLRQDGRPLFRYAQAMIYRASGLPEGSRALLVGLGGGSMAKGLLDLGFEVDAVEIDARLVEVARRHFSLPDRCRVILDDGRHYLNVAEKEYDLIVIDCFSGERIPGHLLTLEAFEKIRRRLTRRGMVMINYTGFVRGPRGLAARSIVRTMKEAGLTVEVAGTHPDEDARNLILAGWRKSPPPPDERRAPPWSAQWRGIFEGEGLDLTREPAKVLRDDVGELELWNVAYHEIHREHVLEDYEWELLLGR